MDLVARVRRTDNIHVNPEHVNKAIKRFRNNASRTSVAPVGGQEEAFGEDQEGGIRSAVPNLAVDDQSARESLAVDLPGAIETNGKGDPNAMERCSGSLENRGTEGVAKSRSVRMDVPEAAGKESKNSLASSGDEKRVEMRFIFGVLQLILLLDAVPLSLVIRILVLGINGELFPDDDAETNHSAELALVDVFAGIVVIPHLPPDLANGPGVFVLLYSGNGDRADEEGKYHRSDGREGSVSQK
ncbi:hypothetical protein FOZ60_015486, partial [Perkinsus olseni]